MGTGPGVAGLNEDSGFAPARTRPTSGRLGTARRDAGEHRADHHVDPRDASRRPGGPEEDGTGATAREPLRPESGDRSKTESRWTGESGCDGPSARRRRKNGASEIGAGEDAGMSRLGVGRDAFRPDVEGRRGRRDWPWFVVQRERS